MTGALSNQIQLVILTLIMAIISSCSHPQRIFQTRKSEAFASQAMPADEKLTIEDAGHLPACVRKYLYFTGAMGKSKPQNMHIRFEAEMFRKAGERPMKSHSEQYNFLGEYSRLFLMSASKMGIPFSALHFYTHGQASFQVKLAGLFRVADVAGEDLTTTETVSLLNDMCLFAPGSLVDKRLSWSMEDSLSARVGLTNGRIRVSATLFFNEAGALVNFVSDDRSALQDDGSLKRLRWSTPVSDYQEFDGRKVPTKGRTIWHDPEGDFTYGVFTLKEIRYNLTK